ncbi:MAG: CHAT domain-containing protein, partial [Anaerolineales bacterium]|nr:CHAT domain-containing protein [Anaerolineales bacterium]
GNIPGALRWFSQTEQEMRDGGYLEASKVATLNIIGSHRALGRYDQALALLHELRQRYDSQQNVYVLRTRIEIVECYLALNRFQEAIAEADQLEQDLSELAEPLLSDKAQLYRHKAVALFETGQLDQARQTLTQASGYFKAIGSTAWLAYCDFQLGRIALRQQDPRTAQQLAESARDYFAAQRQLASLTSSLLLLAECQAQLGDLPSALSSATQALAQTRAIHLPEQRYQAHLLLGRYLLQRGDLNACQRHFQACLRIIKYLRQSLTITLRGDYLADKDEALTALMLTFLQQEKPAKAFSLLEESRALTTADYMANRNRLVWRQDDPISQRLQVELQALREQHGFLYQQAHERSFLSDGQIAVTESGAANQLFQIEKEMRAVVETLYLRSAQTTSYAMAALPTLPSLQQQLAQDEGVIGYYLGPEAWLFWLTRDEIRSYKLPVDGHRLAREIDRLRFTITCALQKSAHSATVAQLKQVTDRVAMNLFAMLLEPIWQQAAEKRRLYIVPHGPLHALPFNLVRSSSGYLIESHELITLPSLSLLKAAPQMQTGPAMILTDDQDGRLPLTRAEGDMVAHMLSTTAHHNSAATLKTIRPGSILHVAAHGEHRPDHPELSYVQLAGKQYFTDDLLQADLRYELVTLSGCETGVVAWNSSETLVGLTQGVLCAGAGALLASYWRVEDSLTLSWMQHFYQALCTGQSKSAALRAAQLLFLHGEAKQHPAYWGAFQLMGQPGPIQTFNRRSGNHA